MDDSSLFQKISSDDTLRRSLLEALQPAPEGDNEEDESVAAGGDTTAVNRPQPDVGDGFEDTPLVADVHQMGRDASLVADACQSRGIGGQEADESCHRPILLGARVTTLRIVIATLHHSIQFQAQLLQRVSTPLIRMK